MELTRPRPWKQSSTCDLIPWRTRSASALQVEPVQARPPSLAPSSIELVVGGSPSSRWIVTTVISHTCPPAIGRSTTSTTLLRSTATCWPRHLRLLKDGQTVDLPVYDYVHHVRLAETERLASKSVLVLEGILILALPAIRELVDIKIFVDTDSDIRFIRRLKRDMAERGRTLAGVVDQYLDTVRPMHLDFVEPSKRWADIIIPEGGYNTVALDLVISRIEGILAQTGDETGADEVG